jgi:hypothetical protein
MKAIQMTVRGMHLSGLVTLCVVGVQAQTPANDALATGVNTAGGSPALPPVSGPRAF